MRIKGLKTENLYFDFRHKDEGETIKIHFHLKEKKNGKKALGEKAGGLIASKNAIQDIHVGKKYTKCFEEVYKHEKEIIKYVEKYLEKTKEYKPDSSDIKGFERYKEKSVKCKKTKKIYVEFSHPNGDDSVAFKFYIRKKDGFTEIGNANVSPNGFKELHVKPEYEIYFKQIYEKRDNLVKYAKKCTVKNLEFLRRIKADVNIQLIKKHTTKEKSVNKENVK